MALTALLLALQVSWGTAVRASEKDAVEVAPGEYVTQARGTKVTRLYDDTRLVSETIESPDSLIERTYDSERGVMYETTRSERRKDGSYARTSFRRVSTRRTLMSH